MDVPPAPLALLERSLTGDHPVEAFDDYYRRDYRSLLGLAYVWTGSAWVAEDLVHEALVEAHRHWSTVAGYDNPGAWVRRVMFNRSTSRFRRLRSETRALTRLGGRRTELALQPSEASAEVWEAVRRLPTRQGQAIALFYWDDWSVADIAEVLDCSIETVRTHLKRGRAALADRLHDHREEGR